MARLVRVGANIGGRAWRTVPSVMAATPGQPREAPRPGVAPRPSRLGGSRGQAGGAAMTDWAACAARSELWALGMSQATAVVCHYRRQASAKDIGGLVQRMNAARARGGTSLTSGPATS